MRISFLGAARTVTGSMHLIEACGKRILLDCGLYQGHRQEAARKNRNLRIRGSDLHAVVLSHAHIDHSGNLPTLLRSGFRGRVHVTHATHSLADLMLRDSARIQMRDVKYLKRKGKPADDPLYTSEHARGILKKFRSWDYDAWFDVCSGVRCRFQDAGHILGSATVHLEIKEPGKERVRVTFTGDLGRPGLPILRDPAPLPEAEILITESTYGGRNHKTKGDVASHMKETLKDALLTAARKAGKLVIPAFSVGRTQNILYFLNELMAEGEIPVTKIFIDSPLATSATDLVRKHPECFDHETLDKLGNDLKPLMANHVYLSRTVRESKLINKVRGTSVIISASGMCEFGRILHHLKHNLPDPNAVIAFVGYQAIHTLGRRLVEGEKKVRIYGTKVPVKARVFRLNGFSAHADKSELLTALSPLRDSTGRTFVVHGEEDQAFALKKSLEQKGFDSVEVPKEGSEFEIT